MIEPVRAAGHRGRAFPRRVVAVLAALAVVANGFSLTPTVAVAADPPDNPSDIPGIPLPGPIVTGILGGAVYDVVYRVDLAPGSIIVASLGGSPGTDFDLYLFDASATTVITNEGVVARSTGPTSDEALAYGTASGGRFYLDLNGASDAQGAYTLTVQTAVDHTPPAVAIEIEGGRPATNEGTVEVSLVATDDLSTIPDMAFSVDGTVFGPWQRFAPTASVILPPGDGPQSVWAKVRNAVGLESVAARATITVDTRPPVATSFTPPPDAHVGSLRPVIRVVFDEAIDAASWVADGLLVQRADGVRVTGQTAVEASGLAATFTPASDLPAGSAVLVTLGPVTDIAGNARAPVPSWAFVPLRPASLVAGSSVRTINPGAAVEISGTYRGISPPPALTVSVRPGGAAAFEPAIEVPVAGNGTFELTVRPTMSTTYRLESPESPTVAAASTELAVAVRRDLRLLVNGAASGTSRAGRKVVVSATAGPPTTGLTVTFRLYRWSPTARAWQLISARARSTALAGTAATGWTPTSPGRYRWRATVSGTAQYSTAYSPWVSWTITR